MRVVLPIPSHLTMGGEFLFLLISVALRRIPRNLEPRFSTFLSMGFSTAKGGRPNEAHSAVQSAPRDGGNGCGTGGHKKSVGNGLADNQGETLINSAVQQWFLFLLRQAAGLCVQQQV